MLHYANLCCYVSASFCFTQSNDGLYLYLVFRTNYFHQASIQDICKLMQLNLRPELAALRTAQESSIVKSKHLSNILYTVTLSKYTKVPWRSGLRRWLKSPLTSMAWVRFPLMSTFFFFTKWS